MDSWKSPAKLNLYLAILDIRESDGFHELDSLVATLDFGDELTVGLLEGTADQFDCTVDGLSWDSNNLLFKAAELFRKRTGFQSALKIHLTKRIPMGAGLGGGSSNASTLLLAMNQLSGQNIEINTLMDWSAELGSDCPLFFSKGLTRIQGRGEFVSQFESNCWDTLRNKRILLVHPGFAITAAWAYKTLRQGYPVGYSQKTDVEQEISVWTGGEVPWKEAHRNDLSFVVDQKYLPIPTLKAELKEKLGVDLYMSGSGSACFSILEPDEDASIIEEFVKSCWGETCFVETTRFL